MQTHFLFLLFSAYIHFMWSILTYAEDGYQLTTLFEGWLSLDLSRSFMVPTSSHLNTKKSMFSLCYIRFLWRERAPCFGGVGHGTRIIFVEDAWFVERKMLKRHPGFVIPSSRSSVATWGSSGRKNHCMFSFLTECMCRGLTSMIFPEGRWLVVVVPSNAIALEIVHCHRWRAVSPSNTLTKVCSQHLQLRKSHDWKMALDFLEKMNVSRVRPNIVPRFIGFSMSVPCWRATMLTQIELVDVIHPRNSKQIPEMMSYLKLEIDFPRPI